MVSPVEKEEEEMRGAEIRVGGKLFFCLFTARDVYKQELNEGLLKGLLKRVYSFCQLLKFGLETIKYESQLVLPNARQKSSWAKSAVSGKRRE